MRHRHALWWMLCLVLACSEDRPPAGPVADLIGSPGAVLIGVGDIASCSRESDAATGALVDSLAGDVLVLGDAAAPSGAVVDYATCYDPTWGRHKARTYPTPGDFDYRTPGAAGYFDYFGSQLARFGSQALDPARGYYSYELSAWHVVALNSNVSMAPGSPQEQWLRADLAAHRAACTLAFWHLPRFYSGGGATNHASVQPLWDALYDGGADVVLNAHTRNYERFTPQDPGGGRDSLYGMREFIVGTGGLGRWGFDTVAPNSEVRAQPLGILKLALYPGGYTWTFVSVPGISFADSGSATCHGPPRNNVPPSVDAGPDLRTEPGASMPLTFRVADPDSEVSWSYTIDWGDGTSEHASAQSLASLFTAGHVYGQAGRYVVGVQAADPKGGTATDTLTVFVDPPGTPQVFVGAGDIASCNTANDQGTATLLDSIPGTVFTLGDNAYPDGSLAAYRDCYGPTWGRLKARTRPAPGNHDYKTPGAAGYYGYFGVAAGDPAKGYYSYDLGAWHILVLNSKVGNPGSPQVQWLRADLAAHPALCTLAYWHAPRFSSGTTHGNEPKTQPLWQALYEGGGDIVLSAHEHNYERFAPQAANATLDSAQGIREFVVGTGGAGSYPFGTPLPNSEVRSRDHGVLKLTLSEGAYSWQFVPVAGATLSDSGSGTCHGAPPPNRAPTAAAGGLYRGSEGGAIRFDGRGSSDPDGNALTYAWSFGDGSTGTGLTPSHTYADNGTYTVTLTVSDTYAAAGSPATTTATITNLPPSLDAGPDRTTGVGSPVGVSARFGDPGLKDGPWAYRIDWGDGTVTTDSAAIQTNPINAAHAYAAAGTDVVRVTVTDKDGGTVTGTFTVTVAPPRETTVTLVGAGNIARCDRTNDEATAALLDSIPGTVFTLGDAAYPGGTAASYTSCYDPSWGRHKARTYPVLGNRDYDSTTTTAAYFSYFGAAAGDPAKGYYSFDLGAWHIVMLNSNNAYVSTAAGSPQETWLKADLSATAKRCVLAMWHTPRFASTTSATLSTNGARAFWDDLYAAGAELILNAHMRDYERFAPQTSGGVADPANGIRQFIVGTGGEGLDAPNTLIHPNSEVNISRVYGVLRLTLGDGTYDWQFIPVEGQAATDAGSGSCH